jgi:hypothetical protein
MLKSFNYLIIPSKISSFVAFLEMSLLRSTDILYLTSLMSPKNRLTSINVSSVPLDYSTF